MATIVKKSLPSVRSFAAQAAVATSQQSSYSLPYHQTQVSKLPSGSVIASLENNSPIATVSVFVKAGARYESGFPNGVSHIVRASAGLTTKSTTAFKVARLVPHLGGTLTAENGREHVRYTITVNRNHLDECLGLLGSIVAEPQFKQWEIEEQLKTVNVELGLRNTTTFSMDLLHRAAFRSGLGNSIFVASFNTAAAGNSEALQKFHSATHTFDRMTISGLGVEHKSLLDFAKTLNLGATGSADNSPSKYKGGDERIEIGGDIAEVAVAGEGAKIGSTESASLAVAQFILGVGPSIKYSSATNSKLVNFAATAGGTGSATAINCNYSDAGLFGFHIRESSDKAGAVAQAIVKALKSAKFTEDEVKQAKNRAKAAVTMGLESQATGVEDMGLQAMFTGNYLSVADVSAALDKVNSASVQKAVSKAFSGKLSIGAVGSIRGVPYADDL